MSGNILRFPGMPEEDTRTRHQKTKGYLANYLRAMASLIENEQVKSDPWAIYIVLTGDEIHEVHHLGQSGVTLYGVKCAVGLYETSLIADSPEDNKFCKGLHEKKTDKELPASYWKNNGHGFIE